MRDEDRQARERRERYAAELEALLAEGWEPFAVTEASYGTFSVWLRSLDSFGEA